MNTKIAARNRRRVKPRAIIRLSGRPRLVVHRSASHIYAQIVVQGQQGDEVIVASSTLDKELRTKLKGTKTEHATQVGKLLAKRAKTKKIEMVAFDRAGYAYHGRVKALAEAAREAGLQF